MYVQHVGWMCVRVDDGDGCVEKGFDDLYLEIDIEMFMLRVWCFEKQNNEMCLKWGSLKKGIIFEYR